MKSFIVLLNFLPAGMGVITLNACLGYFSLVICLSPVLMAQSPNSDITCDKTEVDNCLKNVQTFLRLDSLPFTSDAKELDKLCERAIGGYNCSTQLFTNADCLSDKDREIIPVFISMAQYAFLMLCGNGHNTPGYLADDFLASSACILKNKGKMDCCFRETKMPSLPVLRILEESSKTLPERQISTCCPMTRYLKCAMNVAKENCGDVAFNVTHEYIRRAAGEQVQLVCQKVPHYPEPDTTLCPAPVPTCSGSWRMELHSHLIMAASIFVFYITSNAFITR